MARRPAFPVLVLVAAGLLAPRVSGAASQAKSRKSPHAEIVGQAVVETAPERTVHKNHREFLEFQIALTQASLSAEQPADADGSIAIDTNGRVRVVHDLSCGGGQLMLSAGDRIEIKGEYVKIPKGGDLIHFTHAANASGSCGNGSKHPDGFLRKLAPPASKPAAPRPGSIVPDQPYTGPLPPDRRPYLEIIRLREAGQSNEALLQKVESENVLYSLTTYELQKLRAAGVSTRVIEAMLESGRTEAAPTPTPR